jgi:hypothetical protein
LRFAVYEVRFESDLKAEELKGRVQGLLARREIIRPHHKKQGNTYDLRPLIHTLTSRVVNQRLTLKMILSAGQQGNARAFEVLEALGLDAQHSTIRRAYLLFEEPLNATA